MMRISEWDAGVGVVGVGVIRRCRDSPGRSLIMPKEGKLIGGPADFVSARKSDPAARGRHTGYWCSLI